MADEEDLKLLLTGNKDLSHCDFRGSKISNMDLTNRNFTNSYLEQITAKNCNFSGSDFREASMSRSNFSGSLFNKSLFVQKSMAIIDFSDCEFRDCVFPRMLFSKCNFNRAKFLNCNFAQSRFREDCTFVDTTSDEKTNFHLCQVLRSTSRNAIFQNYIFEKGLLKKKTKTEAKTEIIDSAQNTQEKSINHNRNKVDIFSLCSSINISLNQEISRLNTWLPNAYEQQKEKENSLIFLKKIKLKIEKIEELSEEINPEELEEAYIEKEIIDLKNIFSEWVNKNAKSITFGTLNTGVIATVGVFLCLAGCPPFLSFPIGAAALAGKNPYDVLLEKVRQLDKQ